MKCREVVELVTEYLEGTLSPSQHRLFEEHIAGCDGCQAYLAQLRATRRVLGRLAYEPIPAAVKTDLLKAFRSWKTS
jgi:anti-sigma factor RsiW